MSMSQNITVDDNDNVLIYGAGWGIESPNDPVLDNYFQSTYHATQTLGANVSLSFSGMAIYVFGSKGPGHGNYSVRYDNFVQLLSAQADTLSYRQLLFSTQFVAGGHSITLTNTDNNQSWLDLDFVTVTGPGNTTVSTTFSSTISPLSLAPTSTQFRTSSLASSPSTVAASSTTNSKFNDTTLVLTIAFGILLLFFVVGVAWHLIRCRRSKPSPRHSTAGSASPHRPRSNMNVFSPHPSTHDISPLEAPRPMFISVPANNSQRGSKVEKQRQGHFAHATPPTGPGARPPWSPFASPISRFFAGTKEGADSMKSTFLKV